MGFLIFAARKLMLKRRINDLNYRAMVLSQQKTQVNNSIEQVQQGIAVAKTSVSLFSSTAQEALSKKYAGLYNKIVDGGNAEDPTQIKQLQISFFEEQGKINLASQSVNSIFESASQAQLAPLNALDSQISLEMANIESRTKQLVPELESVEKAEDQAAKQETPKFGL